MVKKMWGLGVGVLIGFVVLGVIVGAAGSSSGSDTLINIISLIANIVFGVNGNSWREKNLASRGFELVDTVTAATPEGAVALYLKEANLSTVRADVVR